MKYTYRWAWRRVWRVFPTYLWSREVAASLADRQQRVNWDRTISYCQPHRALLSRDCRQTTLCWASSFGSQHDAARICCWLAAESIDTRRPQLSIDICCPRPRSSANQPHAAAAVDRRDRQTDGRTPDRYIDPAPHTMSMPTQTRRDQTILSHRVGRRELGVKSCSQHMSWTELN